MQVYWTETAINHLQAIYDYISQNSSQYAAIIVDRLTRRSQQIASFPYSGRVVSTFGQKEIREVIEGSYRIIYWIKAEQIEVIAVVHGSRQMY